MAIVKSTSNTKLDHLWRDIRYFHISQFTTQLNSIMLHFGKTGLFFFSFRFFWLWQRKLTWGPKSLAVFFFFRQMNIVKRFRFLITELRPSSLMHIFRESTPFVPTYGKNSTLASAQEPHCIFPWLFSPLVTSAVTERLTLTASAAYSAQWNYRETSWRVTWKCHVVAALGRHPAEASRSLWFQQPGVFVAVMFTAGGQVCDFFFF